MNIFFYLSLFVSGKTKHNQIPGFTSFVGCLRNVKVNGSPVAFETASKEGGYVNISKCPID